MAVRVVGALRSRGVDVLTAAEAEMLKREDEEQLAFATAQARVLYTFNQGHFLQLHTDWSLARRAHSGIILARQKRYSDREQIRRLSRLTETLSAKDMRNRVEFLSRW